MDQKYRSFPPAVPLKMTKLLEYEYFSQIYKKYDCNFFRQILPYFSEILTTSKIELIKFIYVPIENPKKVPKIQIGIPFRSQAQNKNLNLYQLRDQVTFIKISYQTHIIFQYLMNLNLSNITIQRLKFQDRFWLFSQGVLKSFCFNDIVYKNSLERQQAVIFLLDGEFKCFNNSKKAFKTIGRGYVIDLNGKLKKVVYDYSTKTDRITSEDNNFASCFRQNQTLTSNKEQSDEELHSLWSNSNNAKILVVGLSVIKKYSLNFEDLISVNRNPSTQEKDKLKQQYTKPDQPRPQLNSYMKYRRLKTEKQEIFGRSTYNNQDRSQKSLSKKFNLVSCRVGSTVRQSITMDPIQEISNNEVLKSYTKDKQLYQKMRKEISQRKHKKFFSNFDREEGLGLDRKEQLMPFFKQQLKDDKERVILKRRKTKQLWNNFNHMTHSTESDKENFLAQTKKIVDEINAANNEKKSRETKDGFIRTSSNQARKVSKTELSAFQLLKRNLFNKQYHQADFIQFNT